MASDLDMDRPAKTRVLNKDLISSPWHYWEVGESLRGAA